MKFSRALARFIFAIVLTYLGLLAVTFFIGRVIPIDPVLAMVGDHAPEHVIARTREEMGLNKPLYTQFAIYVGKVLHGRLWHLGAHVQPGAARHRRDFPGHL
jgi:peptide/nickel transport system permease protein